MYNGYIQLCENLLPPLYCCGHKQLRIGTQNVDGLRETSEIMTSSSNGDMSKAVYAKYQTGIVASWTPVLCPHTVPSSYSVKSQIQYP